MPNMKTTEEFILESIGVHQNKYIYKYVVYKGREIKVRIVCKEHGEFLQRPSVHLRGGGCPVCAKEESAKKYSMGLEGFIKKAIEIHGNYYDYSKVVYVNSKTKVIIICPEHGEFEQVPSSHLQGTKCLECSIENNRRDFDEILTEFAKVHNNKYEYPQREWKRMSSKIKIICPTHKEFHQRVSSHLNGRGCIECAYEEFSQSPDEVIERLKVVHNNKFTYPKIEGEILKLDTYIKIICPFHTEFRQKASNHMNGQGCPRCKSERKLVGKHESEVFKPVLESLCENVKIESQYPVERDGYGANFNYYVDFYLPELNLAIEYDEKQHYKPKHVKKDKNRQNYIEKQLGCDFLRINDSEFMENHNILENKLLAFCEAKLSQDETVLLTGGN